jgi:hypothetical protein
MPLQSFDLTLGEHTVRITQLKPADAVVALDALLHAVGPSLSSLLTAVKPGGGEDGAAASLLDAKLELSWPANDTGLGRVRTMFIANAQLQSGTTPDGKELWFPLKDCTDKVFAGHPGLMFRFHALSAKANFANFLADLTSGGAELRPAG